MSPLCICTFKKVANRLGPIYVKSSGCFSICYFAFWSKSAVLPFEQLLWFLISCFAFCQLFYFRISRSSSSSALLPDRLFAFYQLFHFRISCSYSWSEALLPDRLFAFYQLFLFRISRSSFWSAALLLDQLSCFLSAVPLPHQLLFFLISYSASWPITIW